MTDHKDRLWNFFDGPRLIALSILSVVLFTRSFQIFPVAVLIYVLISSLLLFRFFRGSRYMVGSLIGYSTMFIVGIGLFAEIYRHFGVVDATTNTVINSGGVIPYFSVVTWTTLGYGDFRPTVNARPYAAIQAVLGYLYMSALIAKIFVFLSIQNPRNEI